MHRAIGRLVVPALLLSAALAGSACTVFSYAGDGVLLFGSNEDYPYLEPHIWFLEGREPYHGALCLGWADWSLQGGMNTAGLCFDATGSTAITLTWHKEKAAAPPGWPKMILQRCATVDEVETFIRRYDFSTSGMAQFLWFDRNGDSLIVTSGADGEAAFLRQSGGYRVITNFNVTDTSVGTHPCWRYDTAEMMLRQVEAGAVSPTIAMFRAILNGVHQPHATAYSNIFDLTTLTAYIYRNHDYRDVRIIDLAEVFEVGARGLMTLDAYFDATSDGTPRSG